MSLHKFFHYKAKIKVCLKHVHIVREGNNLIFCKFGIFLISNHLQVGLKPTETFTSRNFTHTQVNEEKKHTLYCLESHLTASQKLEEGGCEYRHPIKPLDPSLSIAIKYECMTSIDYKI